MSEKSDEIRNLHEIEDDLNTQMELENLIFHPSKHSLEKLTNLLQEYKNNFYLCELVCISSEVNILSYEILGDIYKLVNDSSYDMSRFTQFSKYINNDEIIQKYEIIDEVIFTDNIQKFCLMHSLSEIDVNEQYTYNGSSFPRLFDALCFFGSLNIIKYLYINKVDVTQNSLNCAIMGGHEDVIDFLERKGYSFHYCINIAIKYHHNQIAIWLYENYENIKEELLFSCASLMNTELFLYFASIRESSLGKIDTFKKNCLHYTAQVNNLLLAEYLLIKGVNQTIRCIASGTPFQISQTNAMKKLLKRYYLNFRRPA